MSKVGKEIIKGLKDFNEKFQTELNTTVDQWKAALAIATKPKYPNAKTITELENELGIPRNVIKSKLKKAAQEGRCKILQDIRKHRLTTVYELVEK